jgi:hypothetical protein
MIAGPQEQSFIYLTLWVEFILKVFIYLEPCQLAQNKTPFLKELLLKTMIKSNFVYMFTKIIKMVIYSARHH